ncbi:hypothetical protein E3P92_01195 [Wallemia ichthyophaga]|uniref:Signal recognition particle subunit SRP68 n=2 Tax=Wallemia ichthyophaga TaxID=245174 RepID=A0A4V4M2C7_WALIC|nr:Signal recognition particle subunit srp68 [Wallemia ichthyophaga EXF-994]TIA94856.1 hypothetical protein E3P96_03998 [Wallemia ichthyophaga]EOR00720.1 Signal recognition particle subunit srp68 [Wallemia ichthyophaga EXF-994]TIA98144.1 hypothetical protein E3P95_02515 [Wallemia ichthyophaga]TIA99324.1 hypothetical protein E3P94_02623 [Wallemia ichthyophaga]TIB15112.1 hypothetical protein E3P90_00954 [Wallemia ichthyophaga]
MSLVFQTLNLLSVERNSYGVRTGDYLRYRKHCTRKINKLRRNLKLTNGKGKRFNKCTAESILRQSDIRVLELLLLSADKYWAESQENKDATSKLRRSDQFANVLIEASSKFGLHSSDTVQLEIYHKFIQGSYNLSKNKFHDALNLLSISYVYLKNLINAAPNDKIRALGEGWLDELSPKIRYCSYQSGNKSTSHEIDRIANEHSSSHSFVQLEYSQEDKPTKVKNLTWRGKELRLTSVDVVEAIHKLQSVIDKKSGKSTQSLSNYDEILNTYTNAIEISPQGLLKQVLTYKMLALRLERDLKINNQLESNEPAKNRSKVKVIDGIIFTLEQLRNLHIVESDDSDLSGYVETKISYHQALKNYTLGLSHLMAHSYGPSIRLLESCKFYNRSGLELLMSLDESTLNHSEAFEPVVDIALIEDLNKMVDTALVNSKKAWFAQQFKRPLFFDIANTYVEPPLDYILDKSQSKDTKPSKKEAQKPPTGHVISSEDSKQTQDSAEKNANKTASSGWFGSLWKR